MREVPYETDHDVRARSRRDEMYERINDFLARGGRGRRTYASYANAWSRWKRTL